MGQVIPFRRVTRPTFTDAEIEQMWDTFSAASRARAMILQSPNATEADLRDAELVVDASQRLFADAFNKAYPEMDYSK